MRVHHLVLRQHHIVCASTQPNGHRPLQWLDELNELEEIDALAIESVNGPLATRRRISATLKRDHDIVIWSGHGAPDRLVLSAGTPVDGHWLATYVKAGAPRIVLVAACMSDAPDDALDSIANAISIAGVNAVSMSCDIDDAAAKTYVVEFCRAMAANADVAMAHTVATHAMDIEEPGSGKIPRLVPGLTNGYRSIMDRLDRTDAKLAVVETNVSEMAGDIHEIRAMVELVARQGGVRSNPFE